MNNSEKLQFVRENLIVHDKDNSYHLDYCDICEKIILRTMYGMDPPDGNFLDKCLGCNLKTCYDCTYYCECDITKFCKNCKHQNDLQECTNCKRKHFKECFEDEDGILCCISCAWNI